MKTKFRHALTILTKVDYSLHAFVFIFHLFFQLFLVLVRVPCSYVFLFLLLQLRVWARPDAINTVDYALEKGADIIDYYGTYYGTEFPLEKMGKYFNRE